MVKVRKATAQDEAKVFDLLGQFPTTGTGYEVYNWQAGQRIFREIVKENGPGSVFVADEDGELLGVVTLSYPVAIHCGGKYSCIEEFIVSERARGKGVGSQLLECAIAEATARGCDELQVNGPSELGYPVYVRMGIKDNGKHLKMKLKPARK